MKIVLIDPPTPCNTNTPNIGLAYIASSLKESGHQVVVRDMARVASNRTITDVTEDADLTGISVKTHNYHEAQRITKEIHGKRVWGGPHVTLVAGKELIAENPEVDHFIVGEGEFFVDMLTEGKLCVMPRISDLDRLPFPCYSLFDSYEQLLNGPYPLICSRGCPYNCSFCSVPLISGKKVRYRSVKNCMKEIEQAKKLGFNRIQVLDDNFTFNMDFAKEFSAEMCLRKCLGLCWYLPNGIRADKFDEELARLMHDSNCYLISFGVESACLDVYKKIGKGETLEDIDRAVELAKKHKFFVNCYFIIGLPGSTFEQDLESLVWAFKHNVKADFNMLVPYPGTRIWSWAQNKLKGTVGTHFGKLVYPTFETEEYSAEDRMDAFLIFNFLSGSGFTKEWYNGDAGKMETDLTMRIQRHMGPLRAAKVIR